MSKGLSIRQTVQLMVSIWLEKADSGPSPKVFNEWNGGYEWTTAVRGRKWGNQVAGVSKDWGHWCASGKSTRNEGSNTLFLTWNQWGVENEQLLYWSWNSNTGGTWWEELTHWKDPDAGKDRRQEEKGMTEDEMVGWHHWLYGHEFE